MRGEEILLLPSSTRAEKLPAELPARRVGTSREIREAVAAAGIDLLWIALTADDLRALLEVIGEMNVMLRNRKKQSLLVLETLGAAQRTLFSELFRHVLAPGDNIRVLPIAELSEVLGAPERADYFVGIAVDPVNGLVLLYRGNLETIVVPFSWFDTPGGGTAPDFADFELTDSGQVVRFGRYEAATSAILYDFDAEYRGRARERELGLDPSLGGSVRRLRLLRGLRQADIPGVSAKEIGRIERGDIADPHAATLRAIARRFGVSVEELRTY